MKHKNTFTAILFYLTIGMLMISIHQSVRRGFTQSYFFYMVTIMLYLWYSYRRTKEQKTESGNTTEKPVNNRKKASGRMRK